MLDRLDRLTIYTVLGFISICALVLQKSASPSVLQVAGLFSTLIGIGAEIYRWQPGSKTEQQKD